MKLSRFLEKSKRSIWVEYVGGQKTEMEFRWNLKAHFQMRILSHNVFWFQGVPFPYDQPGDPVPAIVNECLAIYTGLAPTVLCLQEVQTEQAVKTIATVLGLTAHHTPGGELPQYGGCILSPSGGRLEESSLAARPQPQRMWQVLSLESHHGGKLTIANVHLPSDRQLDATEAAKRRILELQQVLALRPDIICGDFNERPHGRVAAELVSAGYGDCAVLTGNEDRSTSIGARRTDYIWVRSTLTWALRDYGLIPPHSFLSTAKGKSWVSDHFPLWVDLAVD